MKKTDIKKITDQIDTALKGEEIYGEHEQQSWFEIDVHVSFWNSFRYRIDSCREENCISNFLVNKKKGDIS